jgi:Ion channel
LIVISTLSVLLALLAIVVILHDGFEVMLLPRRVSRDLRLTRLYYVGAWQIWRALARRIEPEKRRKVLLSWFGPSSVILLFSVWAAGLILAFGPIHWAIGSPMNTTGAQVPGLFDYLYFSGVTFFTLGFGDFSPQGTAGRMLAVGEAGIGFAFLAVVISYLPVFYQAFSKREVTISLLDARAGSPPTAGSLLLRLAPGKNFGALDRFLQEWEHYAAEVLESHLSFPLLSYYRSQHDNQSWLAALTMILDSCALTIAALKGVDPYQPQLTFAVARHTVVDLCQVFQARPIEPDPDRLPADRLFKLLGQLEAAGLEIADRSLVEARLVELRRMYEPFVNALASQLLFHLPPICVDGNPVDNWQTSAWMKRTRGIGKLALADPGDDHAD